MAFYFVEIIPVSKIDETPTQILAEVQQIVVKHTRQTLRFKIFGEQKIVFVGQDDEPEKVLADVDARFGNAVNFTTTPLRQYEIFAEKILGVDKELCTPMAAGFENPQKLFLVHATVDMPGMGMDELRKIWKEEAGSVLGPRAEGKLDLRLYKIVANRAIYLFMNLPSAEALDDITYAVPLALNPKTADGLRFPTVKELKPF